MNMQNSLCNTGIFSQFVGYSRTTHWSLLCCIRSSLLTVTDTDTDTDIHTDTDTDTDTMLFLGLDIEVAIVMGVPQ